MKYNVIYNFISLSIDDVGTVSIWSTDEIAKLRIHESCSADKPETVEEFMEYQAKQKERQKLIGQAYMAFKYIINVDMEDLK